MSSTSVQYQLNKPGGQFSLATVPRPTPGPDVVCIRTKAAALNPLDWKNRNFGIMIQAWPAVLGLDGAGIVESVGESVRDFKPGDEVFSHAGMSSRAGSFQEVYTVTSNMVAKKPASLSFEEAASLPLVYLTAASAIVNGFHIALPHLDPTGNRGSLKSVLILGASSGVGASAIQLLRLALPELIILATSSDKHHEHLLSLGATKVFERSAQDNTSVIKAATPEGAGVDAILDTVTAAAGQPAVFTALSPDGPKIYAQVVTGQNPGVPEGVNAIPIIARQLYSTKGGTNAMPALADLIESGKFRLPVKVEIVGSGLESIAQGLDKLQREISGAKYVVSV